jgi:periplasmic protein TonB
MFDLVTGKARHLPSHPALPMVLSTTAQAAAVVALLVVPALFVAERLPEMPTMMAFVAPPPPPPAPPPPPLQRRAEAEPVRTAQAVPRPSEFVAPVEAPTTLSPESAPEGEFDEGVPGGVEGGVPGGIVGGVVGGLPEPVPPPPAAAAVPKAPVRVGGQISAPELLYRVEPVYPGVAVAARIQGVAILETIVDEEGRVTDVRMLRSAHTLLDGAAVAAVRQWRYKPVVLNGVPVKFILTVTLSFRLEEKKG